MRILLVSSGSGSRGGGEIFLAYLAEGLARIGHEVLLWIPSHSRMDELAARCAAFAEVMRGDYRNTYDYRSRSLGTLRNGVAARLSKDWRSIGPDVIHINKQNLEDGLDLLGAAGDTGLPSVCTIHLTQTARYLRAKGAVLRDWIAHRRLSAYRGVFVTVQETRRAELSRFLPPSARTAFVLNGVPAGNRASSAEVRSAKRRELGLQDSDFLVLGLGRLVEQKRPFVFLETAAEIHRRFDAARFLWVGDGALAARWRAAVEARGLQGVVSCAGWQPEVHPYLAAADLLLHVAEYEGLPLAIIEAMAAGVPCAVTRNLAAEVELFDEKTVLFVEDVDDLARRLRNRVELTGIADNARALVKRHLSVEAMAGAYERLYSAEIESFQS